MKPLQKMKASGVRAIFFDIDDTLTTQGKLGSAAYRSLWSAQRAGVKLVPVTGRPAGWCDHIARMWPVDGVVGENGAFAMYYARRKLRRIDVLSEAARAKNRKKLDALGEHIVKTVRGSALASDQAYRDYDLAIDFCEDVMPLPDEKVSQIVHEMERAGATAKISSIHVNGWFGEYTKLQMAKRFMTEILGLEGKRGFPDCVFVGDSPNDQPMFEAFSRSVGVANVRVFADRMTTMPAYVTRRAHGEGFADVVRMVLAARPRRRLA